MGFMMDMILEIKNIDNGRWEFFSILTVRNNNFRGGLKTTIPLGYLIEMRFVSLNGDSSTSIEGEFLGRINSIRHLDESGYYLFCGKVVNGQDIWERLSMYLLK